MRWIECEIDGVTRRVAVARQGRALWYGLEGRAHCLAPQHVAQREATALAGDVCAPMTGKVVDVRATCGDTVREGAVLVVLEAMKMEYRLVAPQAGTIRYVHCKGGDLVDLGTVLLEVEAA